MEQIGGLPAIFAAPGILAVSIVLPWAAAPVLVTAWLAIPTVFAWSGRIHNHVATAQIAVVQAIDRLLRLIGVGHLDKTKTARPASELILNYGDRSYLPKS